MAKKKSTLIFCFVLGTRPEIIKVFPLIDEVQKRKLNFEIVHTGQHHAKVLQAEIWKDLKLPKITHKLNLKKSKNKPAGAVLGDMIEKLSIYFQKNNKKNRIIIVQGDTNSTLAGALVANKLKIPLVHVEAGFRSHLKTQPEEMNRILVDHMSDLNIATDLEAFNNLKNEGLIKGIFRSTNTAYSAANVMLKDCEINQKMIFSFYQLMTIHRAENTDNPARLFKIWQLANILATEFPLIWVMHPRTQPRLEKILKTKLKVHNKIKPKDLNEPSLIFLSPQGYKKFFDLLLHSQSIYSDSGGIVDESVFLGKPYVCLRSETEQHEVVKKRRMLLLSPELPLSEILHKAKVFLRAKYPLLKDREKQSLLRAPKEMISNIEKFFNP
jgi:UDP-N-acetylglucosamine 2-epimerase (non-hydrolysing)